MPSPIAHSTTGYVIGQLLGPRCELLKATNNWKHSAYAILVANFADFDFIPQLLTDERFHRGPTHSVWFAVMFSLGSALVFKGLGKRPFRTWFIYTFLLYGSHLLLDFLTAGGNGMPLLWPFADSTYKASFSLFPRVNHSEGLFYLGHFLFITFELIFSTLILAGFWKTKNNNNQQDLAKSSGISNEEYTYSNNHDHTKEKSYKWLEK